MPLQKIKKDASRIFSDASVELNFFGGKKKTLKFYRSWKFLRTLESRNVADQSTKLSRSAFDTFNIHLPLIFMPDLISF